MMFKVPTAMKITFRSIANLCNKRNVKHGKLTIMYIFMCRSIRRTIVQHVA